MSDDDRLRDIREYGRVAIALATTLEAPVPATDTTRLALERALFVVGEAAAGLSDATRRSIDQPWRAIIGLRNVIAHDYGQIRLARLLGTTEAHVPELLDAVDAYLGDA